MDVTEKHTGFKFSGLINVFQAKLVTVKIVYMGIAKHNTFILLIFIMHVTAKERSIRLVFVPRLLIISPFSLQGRPN